MTAEIYYAEDGEVWTGRYHEEDASGTTGTDITTGYAPEPISDPDGTVGPNDVSVWVDGVEDTVTGVSGTTVSITTSLTGSETVIVKYADWVQKRSAQVTNIEVTGGTRDTETIRTFHANSILREKPMEQIESTVTAVSDNLDWAYMWLGTPVEGSPITPTYPITVAGDQTKDKWVVVYDYKKMSGTQENELRFVFKDAVCTEAPTSNASDGYLEEKATFKVKPVDFLKQETNDTTASPLTKVLSGAGV